MASDAPTAQARSAHPALDTRRVSLALELEVPLERDTLIEALHRFIRDDHFVDEIPVDVAIYAHLCEGPQVLLICHYGQLAYAIEDGVHTLRWSSRRAREQSFEQRLRHAAELLLRAARLLRDDPKIELRPRHGTLRFGIRDRLNAPASAEARAVIEPHLGALVAELCGGASPTLTAGSDERDGLTLHLSFEGALSDL